MLEINTIHLGDCLDLMGDIPDKTIDMIICDLPYGTTACKWDTVIPFDPLWGHYKRVIKDNGAIVLTGSQPFTSALVMSNIEWFKYEWIWDKMILAGMSYARFQPMRQHENILVFCKTSTKYNPQKLIRHRSIKSGGMSKGETTNNQKLIKINRLYKEKNPISILEFLKVRQESTHPTQKPIALFEYLIETYTNKGDLVLDNCAGSGTTGIACKNLERDFILIEKDPDYFKLAKERIEKHRHTIRIDFDCAI